MIVPVLVVVVTLAACYLWLTVRVINRKGRWARWKRAGLPIVAVLYLLSSGPMHGAAFRNTSIIGYDPDGSLVLSKPENWWPKAYAPVIWASERPWGKSLKTYWNCFPIVQAKE